MRENDRILVTGKIRSGGVIKPTLFFCLMKFDIHGFEFDHVFRHCRFFNVPSVTSVCLLPLIFCTQVHLETYKHGHGFMLAFRYTCRQM